MPCSGYQSGPHSGYQSGSSSSGYPDNFSSSSIESNSVSSEEEASPQASRRISAPSSVAAETSSSKNSDRSTTEGTSTKKCGGASLNKLKFSSELSDSGLSTLGTSDLEEEQNLPTGKDRKVCFLSATSQHLFLTCSDPMKWSCEDVLLWIDIMTKKVGISEVDKRFFCMSGIGVAFIPRHGFVRRLGSKGLLLYQDFHHRLKAARCSHS